MHFVVYAQCDRIYHCYIVLNAVSNFNFYTAFPPMKKTYVCISIPVLYIHNKITRSLAIYEFGNEMYRTCGVSGWVE